MKKNLCLVCTMILLMLGGCASEHFIIYSMDGKKYSERANNFNTGSRYDFKLFFNRDKIESEYDEIAIFSTDNFYYGHFFFDEVFMKILKTKVNEINADAVIYEKQRKNFPHYNENFLYFTAIRYKFD